MAKAKPAIVVIVILVLLQVSWATAARLHWDKPAKHCGGTPAVMTLKLEGTNGGCACDGRHYCDDDLVVTLSSKWYAGGKRCNKNIRITSEHTGRTVVAKVVDEYNSRYHHGACVDCRNDNVVAASPAVWNKLALPCPRSGKKQVPVTWSDA